MCVLKAKCERCTGKLLRIIGMVNGSFRYEFSLPHIGMCTLALISVYFCLSHVKFLGLNA